MKSVKFTNLNASHFICTFHIANTQNNLVVSERPVFVTR